MLCLATAVLIAAGPYACLYAGNVIKGWRRYGVERGIFRKGFYRGSYDAEHGCKLFPMLWACIELFPDDEKIIRTNRQLADMLCSPVYFHPELHFLRYSAMNAMLTAETAPRAMRKARGDNAGNTMYATAPWLAYLTTGDEKYRTWVLNYAKAWDLIRTKAAYDRSQTVKLRALKMLGRQKNDKNLEVFLDVLEKDKSKAVKDRIFWIFRRLYKDHPKVKETLNREK